MPVNNDSQSEGEHPRVLASHATVSSIQLLYLSLSTRDMVSDGRCKGLTSGKHLRFLMEAHPRAR
jgi:hypothetical protein